MHTWGYIVDASGSVGLAEVLGEQLGRHGIAAVTSLGGNFAAIAHSPSMGVTALIRDAIGTVPLYWCPVGRPVRAHADLRVVLAATGLDSLDMAFVDAETDGELHRDPAATHILGLRRVPPGVVVFVGSDADTAWQYFRPKWMKTQRISRAAAVDQMRDVIERSVCDASKSQQPASHISGGLDSSLVTALAQQHGPVGPTFSWTMWPVAPGEEPSDEQARLACAVEALALDPIYTQVSDERADWLQDVDPMLLPPWGYLTYEASTLPIARDSGATVILSGWGGDDFASSGMRRAEAWIGTGHFRDLLAHRLAQAPPSRLGRLRSVGLHSIGRYHWGPKVAPSPGAAMDWRQPIPQRRCDHWWLAARYFDLEYRYPLLDPRVVRAAASMPPTYFGNEGISRWGFRMLTAEHLPIGVSQVTSKAEPQRVRHLATDSDHLREVTRARRFRPQLLASLSRRQQQLRDTVELLDPTGTGSD